MRLGIKVTQHVGVGVLNPDWREQGWLGWAVVGGLRQHDVGSLGQTSYGQEGEGLPVC